MQLGAAAANVGSSEHSRQIWGYIVWALTGLAVAVPEIWAAKWPDSAPFPTISGTVGYIEYWHDWVALLVIGVLIWAAVHAVKFSNQEKYIASPHHTPAGRFTFVDVNANPKEPFDGYAAVAYYAVALVCTIGVPLLVDQWRPKDEYLLGEVMYGTLGVFAFVLPGSAALFTGKDIPFTTLFVTIQNIERKASPVAVLFGAGIAILLLHLALYPWPSVIPDLQDLHHQKNPSHAQQKQREPDPQAP
jgi:hypothetical protein